LYSGIFLKATAVTCGVVADHLGIADIAGWLRARAGKKELQSFRE
jgi:hypothetical protein